VHYTVRNEWKERTMAKRLAVLAVVLLILATVGYVFGVGQAVACGIAAVVVYIYAMYKRYKGVKPPGG
jgi:uncharacterized membrane protein